MNFYNFLQDSFGEHTPSKICELVLDKMFTCEELTLDHKETLEKYTDLKSLSLSGIGLKSITNFPFLPNLKVLNLNNNNLTSKDILELPKYFPKLTYLKIDSNKLSSFEPLQVFANTNLRKLNIEGNLFSLKDNLNSIFEMLKNLLLINRNNRAGEEFESSSEEEDSEVDEEEDDDDELENELNKYSEEEDDEDDNLEDIILDLLNNDNEEEERDVDKSYKNTMEVKNK